MNTKVASSVRKLFRWWLGELAGTFPPRLHALVKQTRSPGLIVLKSAGILVSDATWQLPEDSALIPVDGESAEDVAKSIGTCTRKGILARRDIQIAVSPEEMHDTVIDLPMAAASNVQAVLNEEIDRHTPFSSASSYHDFRVLSASDENQTISVQLKTVPRRTIDTVISASKMAGLSPVCVCAEDDLLKLDRFEFHPPGLVRRRNRRSATRIALLAFVSVALTLVALYLPVQKAHKANAFLDAELAELGARLTASEDNGELAKDALAGLMSVADLKRQNPPVVLLLDEISKILPDHSYVRQLRIDQDTVEVFGLTENANDIIRVFDRSEKLSNARFPAPVKRAGLSSLDQFQLKLDINGTEK